MSDEIDPSWPPPAPKSSDERDPAWPPAAPEASQTAAPSTPQQPASGPTPFDTSTERETSPSSGRPAWQRPAVLIQVTFVITALLAVAVTVAIVHSQPTPPSAQGTPGTVGASPQLPTTVTSTSSTTAALGSGVASVSPPASPPGPGEPGYCGAHTDGMDCWANTGPMTPGEAAFLNDVRGQVPGDDTTLLENVRGICGMVNGGLVTSYILSDIAQHYGITNASAVQVMNAATSFACH
jgi:hypothetical protein